MTGDQRPDAGSQQARWEAAHAEPRFRPRYPQEQVVRWIMRNFARGTKPPARLLDLGCGAGRHALFFAAEGFESYASDISRTGLAHLEAAAGEKGLAVRTAHAPSHDLSAYADASMDGILSYGVLYYLTLAEARQAVREVHRVLRPGGQFMCVVRSDADSRRAHASQVGPCTWRLDALAEGVASDMETGMQMLFFSRAEVEQLFAPFGQPCIDRMSYRHLDFVDDDWVVTATRT